MTDWRITEERSETPPDRWRHLPTPRMPVDPPGKDYIPHRELIDAINVSIALGQPLLVTGEAGCGKTALGSYVAWELGLGELIRFSAKSNMSGRDLFYRFDMVGYFSAAQIRSQRATRTAKGAKSPASAGRLNPVEFINYQALGEAILLANPLADVEHVVPSDRTHNGPRRSVVLIDEIDKAPRDVPNDILGELEDMRFRIPELDAEVSADPSMRPILVLTSNSEKALPDPFLRRCVFYDMPFPDDDTLKEIATARILDLPRDAGLADDVIDLFRFLRDGRHHLRKRPGTAEFLGFLNALLDRGLTPSAALKDSDDWQRMATLTLFKTREDQGRAADILKKFAGPTTTEPAT